MINTQTIAKMLLIEVEKGTSLDVLLEKTKQTLTKYKLQAVYPSVLKAFEEQLLVLKKNQTLYVETPYSLDEEAILNIKKITNTTTADIVQIHKPQLLAGFRAIVDGKVYDASASAYISELRKNILI